VAEFALPEPPPHWSRGKGMSLWGGEEKKEKMFFTKGATPMGPTFL